MPANQRQQPPQTSSSTAKPSSKYTNKDGSKYITIPKNITSTDSAPSSPAMPPSNPKTNGQSSAPPASTEGSAPTVNRKKQKRREKEKAKLAAQLSANAQPNGVHPAVSSKRQMEELEERFHNHGLQDSYGEQDQFDPADGDVYDSEEGDYPAPYAPNGKVNGYSIPPGRSPQSSKKKKSSRNSVASSSELTKRLPNGISHNHISIPPLAPTNVPRGPGISKEKIWNTSSQEERERIKEFWLSLGEDERKSLVKVEKDAVLKKMKEQQKHSCSCTVCGRKRTAIEEELEVLYDAYYEELEQYANHQGDGPPPPMLPPPRRFGDLTGLQPPHRLPPAFNGQQPSRGRIVEQLGDDEEEEDDEEYSEEGDEEDYSDEDEPEELPRSHATDFFNFGNSLTVQGGILTVADDLLKNDGKKFIEMMEQLAERRMQREEVQREQQYSNPNYGHPPNGAIHSHSHNHSHPPPAPEEDYDDEEDDEEYESGDEEDYDDEEEMDTMTEEQRMEEGRRMFQIFAARMFEQRVLTAYKEKIAKERQQKLLEELAEEEVADSQKKAKKAKDAQKKKEKLAQKKHAQAEEKSRREAEKAAEEAAIRAAEEKKQEEQRQKAEEKRKKREAQKKAEEEERLRKEAEKQKRLQEARDRQAEAERKIREAKEKERKEKEELRQKEKEAKEAREREAKERKEKQEREKREKEAKLKAEKEAAEKLAREELAAQKAIAQAALAATQAAKRTQTSAPAPAVPTPQQTVVPPHVPVVTPAIPKVPTPSKLRTTPLQNSTDSNPSLPATPQTNLLNQNSSPSSSSPLQGSPGPIGPPGKIHQPFLPQAQNAPTSPVQFGGIKSPPGIPPSQFAGLPPMGMNGPGPGPILGAFNQPLFPPFHPSHFGPPPHHAGPFPPMPISRGRGFPPPGFGQPMHGVVPGGFNVLKENNVAPTHSRQQSGSFDKPAEGAPAQPIARPVGIGRPNSVVHGQRPGESRGADIDDLSNHLGSSALLDDTDEPLGLDSGVRRPSVAPGNPHRPFPMAPYGMDNMGFGNPTMYGNNTWGSGPSVFGGPPVPGSGFWPQNPMFGSPMPHPVQPVRPVQPQSVSWRLMICRACNMLKGSVPSPDGYYDVKKVREFIERYHPTELPIPEDKLLEICETEGNAHNGGGTFDIRLDSKGQPSIRYDDDAPPTSRPGEIGSPVIGSIGTSRFHGPPGL